MKKIVICALEEFNRRHFSGQRTSSEKILHGVSTYLHLQTGLMSQIVPLNTTNSASTLFKEELYYLCPFCEVCTCVHTYLIKLHYSSKILINFSEYRSCMYINIFKLIEKFHT